MGRVGLSVRYLQKRGLSTSVGVSASAAREVASVVVHLLLIVVFALWAGQTDALGSEFDILPSTDTLLAIGGVVLGVAGLVIAIPRVRKLVGERAIPAIRDAATAMRQVAASPLKMLSLLVGSALVPIGFIAALYFSVQAFAGGASFTAVGLVFLTVGALAAAAPTPGGIGAVEAVLLAALTGLGIAAPAALAAVFLYRIITVLAAAGTWCSRLSAAQPPGCHLRYWESVDCGQHLERVREVGRVRAGELHPAPVGGVRERQRPGVQPLPGQPEPGGQRGSAP